MTPPVPVSQIATATDLLDAYAAGQRNFEYVSLADTDLSGTDLKGCDFSYADFSGSNLSQTNLRGADLSYANLTETDLSAADLRGAMLIGTDLTHRHHYQRPVCRRRLRPPRNPLSLRVRPQTAGPQSRSLRGYSGSLSKRALASWSFSR